MQIFITLTILVSSLYSFGSVTNIEYIKKDKGIDIVKVYFEKCVNKNRINIDNESIEFIELGDMRFFLKNNINLIPTGNKKPIKDKNGKVIYYHGQMKAEMQCMRIDKTYFNCVVTEKHLAELKAINERANSGKLKQ